MAKKQTFQHILLIGRPGVTGISETLQAVANYLFHKKRQILVETTTATLFDCSQYDIVNAQDIPKKCDLIIVVGGDGSLLNAAHIALPFGLPVLGINRGRLGFLTDIHPNHLDRIGEVIDGDYELESRFLLEAKQLHDSEDLLDIALNDVVLLPGDMAHMIEFEIYINERFVCTQRADGLIITTPTGSTAYALSGGGPILHPSLEAVALVPMFPHKLSSRPIVIESSSQIDIVISASNDISPYVSCDGMKKKAMLPSSRLRVCRHQQMLTLIHPTEYSYFATLREKLGWETHQ